MLRFGVESTALLTPKWTAVFRAGDGLYAVNGEVTKLGPFPQNKPPYVAYQLFRCEDYAMDSPFVRLQVDTIRLTEEVQSGIIASDGAEKIDDFAEHKLPGRKDNLGPLRQFWEKPEFVTNRDGIRRRLALATTDAFVLVNRSGESPSVRTENGLLPDDTTIVAWQRPLAT